MPQLIAVFVAGAGIYAGLKWLSRTLESHARVAARQAEELRRRAEKSGRVPKDLGTLELDPESGVYKPRTRRGA
jgi:hypothetical protein